MQLDQNEFKYKSCETKRNKKHNQKALAFCVTRSNWKFRLFWQHQIAHQSIASSPHSKLCIVCSLHHFCTQCIKNELHSYTYAPSIKHWGIRMVDFVRNETHSQMFISSFWVSFFSTLCSFPLPHLPIGFFEIVGSKFYTCSTDQVHGKKKKKKNKMKQIYTIYILISIQLKMPNIFFF